MISSYIRHKELHGVQNGGNVSYCVISHKAFLKHVSLMEAGVLKSSC